MQDIIKIKRKYFYSLYEIAKYDLFELKEGTFDVKRNRARRIIIADKIYGGKLNASIVPDEVKKGKKRYAVQGANIIKYLANKDDRKRA